MESVEQEDRETLFIFLVVLVIVYIFVSRCFCLQPLVSLLLSTLVALLAAFIFASQFYLENRLSLTFILLVTSIITIQCGSRICYNALTV